MKRHVFLLIEICLLLLIVTALSFPHDDAMEVSEINRGLNGLTIVIDPGHGGIDHGASNASGVLEDVLNLKISLILKDKLTQAGANVILTRDSADVDYSGLEATRKKRDMNNRAELIKKSKPDAVISIHMNKGRNQKYFGPQTYFWKDSENGRKLASDMQDALLGSLPSYKKFFIIPGDFFMLHVVDAPSVLVECGFLSNAADTKRLLDPIYQQKIADSITNGLYKYFNVQS